MMDWMLEAHCAVRRTIADGCKTRRRSSASTASSAKLFYTHAFEAGLEKPSLFQRELFASMSVEPNNFSEKKYRLSRVYVFRFFYGFSKVFSARRQNSNAHEF